MRVPRALRAAALIATAVLLGLLAVQGTYALWNAATTAAPGTVQAASFTVNLTGSPSGASSPMTLANGQAAILSLNSTAASLTPGTSAYASATVVNASDAGGTFSISVTAESANVANVGTGTLAASLTVNAKIGATTAECSVTTGYNTALTATTGLSSAAVPKGGSTVVCFQVTLAANAPAAVKGQSATITVPLTARQLCGVPTGCP
ncbi:SipW-dependent-type signal peptide-containing protein [Arthrobacter sp. NPDC057013]|uniref:SipW-dependent-type signal peptide-containing protein n=1 Tax=Arthrobacter sp. NPDC057013 TaxID=3345999 RepID=UPI003641688F